MDGCSWIEISVSGRLFSSSNVFHILCLVLGGGGGNYMWAVLLPDSKTPPHQKEPVVIRLIL